MNANMTVTSSNKVWATFYIYFFFAKHIRYSMSLNALKVFAKIK